MRPDTVRLRIERERAKHQRWTQESIAEALGLPQTAVSKRLLGKVEWRITELQRLARHLDIPLSELIPDDVEDVEDPTGAEQVPA